MICSWAKKEIDIEYHNNIFGKKVFDDNKMFEALCLEIMQVGLSWHIVLLKKEDLRLAFYDFNIEKVANISDKEILNMLNNTKIIRHKAKIQAIINNAKCILKIKEEKDFTKYIYNLGADVEIVLKELKKQNFKFIGEKTINSFLQSIGVINGHEKNCSYR